MRVHDIKIRNAVIFAGFILLCAVSIPPCSADNQLQVTVTASPASISAGSPAQILVTATYYGQPLSGATVLVTTNSGSTTLTPSSGQTDSSGRASFRLDTASSTSGTVRVSASVTKQSIDVGTIAGNGYVDVPVQPVVAIPLQDVIVVPLPPAPQPQPYQPPAAPPYQPPAAPPYQPPAPQQPLPAGAQAPVAVISVDTYAGNIPLTVTFDGQQSYAPSGSISSYAWDFGDGSTGTGYIAQHTYSAPGTFTASLIVTDNNGLPSNPATMQIFVQPSSGDRLPLGTRNINIVASMEPENPGPQDPITLTVRYQKVVSNPHIDIIIDGTTIQSCDNLECIAKLGPRTTDLKYRIGYRDENGVTATIDKVVPVKTNAVLCLKTEDKDCDGYPNDRDNCPAVYNPDQNDYDQESSSNCAPGPGKKPLCKLMPSDDRGNACDNCWYAENKDQLDSDGDCISFQNDPAYWDNKKGWLRDPQCGDACDSCPNFNNTIDTDRDGVSDGCDNCRYVPNSDQKDYDGDCSGSILKDPAYRDQSKKIWIKDPVCGNACDICPGFDNHADADHDGIPDECDKCPGFDDHADADHDGIPDKCDNCPTAYNIDQDPSACTPYIKLLFVPMNWNGKQADFESDGNQEVTFFTDNIPLKACPYRINITYLNVATQNFNTFTCSQTDTGLDHVRDFVKGLGIRMEDYNVIIGLVQTTPCSPYYGWSNGENTIWVTYDSLNDSVTAHELGHIYGLSDEYCSNPAGNTDCRCNDGDLGSCNDKGNDGAVTGDKNWLDKNLGCDPNGAPCCTFCSRVKMNVCCNGNNATLLSGSCIMSYADAPGPRAYCQHCKDWLATIPQLQCHSPPLPLNRTIVDVSLSIHQDDSVTDDSFILTDGIPSWNYQQGTDYELRILDSEANVVWNTNMNIYFDYNGPVMKGVDYSSIKFTSFPFNYRIPYNNSMQKFELYHNGTLIFSKRLNFCNNNGVCDTTETHQTCPNDCPLDHKDKVCSPVKDGVCDPDCLPNVDPDCTFPAILQVFGIILIFLAGVAGCSWYILKKKKQTTNNK